MTNLPNGTRVMVLPKHPSHVVEDTPDEIKGQIGVILTTIFYENSEKPRLYLVEFPFEFDWGHSGGDWDEVCGKNGHCRYLLIDAVRRVEPTAYKVGRRKFNDIDAAIVHATKLAKTRGSHAEIKPVF